MVFHSTTNHNLFYSAIYCIYISFAFQLILLDNCSGITIVLIWCHFAMNILVIHFLLENNRCKCLVAVRNNVLGDVTVILH